MTASHEPGLGILTAQHGLSCSCYSQVATLPTMQALSVSMHLQSQASCLHTLLLSARAGTATVYGLCNIHVLAGTVAGMCLCLLM